MRVLLELKCQMVWIEVFPSSDGFNCKIQEMDGASDACYDSMRDERVERSSEFCRGGTRTTRTVIG